MRCSACGSENRPGARFCNECGAALAVVCAACGQGNPPGSRFCDTCGQSLTAPTRAAEPTPEPAPASPRSYTPRHLAQKILAGREALQGERKQITVLFADVVGSTELIRDRDPEEAQRLLDGAVERMMAAVHRYEGTVSRLQGDGLMAMFGAPVAHEDHAVRACYAALAMVEAVRAYADEVRRAHGAAIQIQVGVNSGEVIVRLISDDLHMDYTAMGQTVHLASRMEGLANAGAVVLTASTLALAEGFVDVRSLGPTTVKGLEQPVDVFELVGVGMARTRLQAAAARGLTPFVGRQEERAALSRALARVRAGQGQVVALVAEAGVGKSRLVWEAAHSDHASGFRMLQTGAVSYGQTTAWLPISDLLRTYFQIENRDDHAAMRAKVIGGVQALDSALAPNLPALLSLLDLPVEDDAWTALDPPRRRAATLDAVRRLVLRESQDRPLLLVFEDLHWIDAETQALLDSLIEALPTSRILLLVNYRPEYTHAWGNTSYYTQLRIAPLEQQSAETLLDALLGPDLSVQLLKPLLIRRTEGTPLFLEESVRALVETGALIGERGAYRLVGAVEEIRVPATVQAVVAARIDRLPAEEKRLFQTAAVIGKDVPFTLLDAIAGTPDSELREALSRLQAAEMLYPLRLFPEPEYTFKHALTHDVAYGSLLQERRRELHGQIVAAIERLYPDRLAEHVERLAHHATRGELWDVATAYLHQAGLRAADRSANREASGWLERALEAVERLPSSRETMALALQLRLEFWWSLGSIGSFTQQSRTLAEAEQLAIALGDQRQQAGVRAMQASSLRNMGRSDEALAAGQRALKLAEASGDRPAYTFAMHQLAEIHRSRGQLRSAANALRLFIDVPGADQGHQVFHPRQASFQVARPILCWTLGELGDFEEAIEQGKIGIGVCEVLGNPSRVLLAWNTLARTYLERGDLANALPLLIPGLERVRTIDDTGRLGWSLATRGLAHTLSGEPALAIPLLREALQITAVGLAGSRPLWEVWLAEAYLATAQIHDARRTVADAIAAATTQQERANVAYALRAQGEIATSGDAPALDEAERSYRGALTLAEQLEMRPLQARCHLGLGKLYHRVGRPEEARAELSMAVDMLREMGMTLWLPEAESELAKTDASAPVEPAG